MFSPSTSAVSYTHLDVYKRQTLSYLLLRPRAYYACVLITATYVTIHPWAVGLASGGFRSGLLPMLWALVGPAGALLLIGVRPALVNAALYVVLALSLIHI